MSRLMKSDFMVSLNHDFISLMAALFSISMLNRINSMCIEPNLALRHGTLG
jgi:hypothetical protein